MTIGRREGQQSSRQFEQDELRLSTPVHSLEARVGGNIAADAGNKLVDIWFIYAGQRVTQVPQGATFEIHITPLITYEYVHARSNYPWDPSPDWKIVGMAVCWAENRAVWRDALAYGQVTYNPADLHLSDTFPGYSPAVMGTANQSWTVYLIANLAGTAATLTPIELKNAFGA
jgi:hypothetical protein